MDHLGFIIAAFGVTFIVIGALIGYILLDYRALQRDLARMSAQEVESRKSDDAH
jgi:heme exporter protein D